MSVTEILVAIGGLAIGYWFVAVFLPARRQPDEPGAGPGDHRDDPVEPAREDPTRHWSDVLDISAMASREEIVAAYKRRISEYHPDKVATMGCEIRDLAQQRSAQINAAYDEAMKQFPDG